MTIAVQEAQVHMDDLISVTDLKEFFGCSIEFFHLATQIHLETRVALMQSAPNSQAAAHSCWHL